MIEAENINKEPNDVEIIYFTPSTLKFILMSVCTFGVYEFYWFYKNWRLYKNQTGKNIMPVWRAIFAFIWSFSLFGHINDEAERKGVPIPIYANEILMGVLCLVLYPLYKLPDPYWLLSTFTFLPLMIINAIGLKANYQSASFVPNDKFSKLNWFTIIIGGSVFVLGVVCTFIPTK